MVNSKKSNVLIVYASEIIVTGNDMKEGSKLNANLAMEFEGYLSKEVHSYS